MSFGGCCVFEKLKIWIIGVTALVFVFMMLPVQNITNYIKFELYKKTDLYFKLNLVNPSIETLAADPSNNLVMRVEVRNSQGLPVPKALVEMSVSQGMGEIQPTKVRTDQNGESLVSFIPEDIFAESKASTNGSGKATGQTSIENANVTIIARINKSDSKSQINVKLERNPVIFVHGYLAGGYLFDNMKEYLDNKGYKTTALDYRSENGVVYGSKELGIILQSQKKLYLSQGFQVRKFDVIAHSMGGLVARYYTCSRDYIKNDDVRKLIFIAVPHKGSPWASLGAEFYHDQGIKDLFPDGPLQTEIFPGMINQGLNNTIQTGNITCEYDEVVSADSASLDAWNIKTDVFNIGSSNYTMDNLFTGKIMETSNHKNILSNKKVFERIDKMLAGNLAYPTVEKP
jgi:pimeloyl-ACP methyl ester carboxylesterase